MKYAVSSREMQSYDKNTSEYFGVPSLVLMERASLQVVSRIMNWVSDRVTNRRYKAVVFCGVGNNGGDGACIARLLKQRGIVVTVCVIGDYTKCTGQLLTQLKILEKYGVNTDTFSHIRDNKSSAEWDIIVDALFGIGLSRNLSGDYAGAVDYINTCKRERDRDLLVTSVDIASGINADNGKVCGCAVKADMTVTFNQTKLGQILYPGCEYTGKLFVEDAGITDESFLGKEPQFFYYDESVEKLLPPRKRDSNKGTNGKILIIAGSKSVSGACILASTACLRSGAGMVKVFTAVENAEVVKNLLPEAMLDTYSENDPFEDKLRNAFKWSTAAVIGPGLGTTVISKKILKLTLEEYDKDIVVDADAINLIAENEGLKKLCENYSSNGKNMVMTPHIAEFARLSGFSISEVKEHFLEYPKELAKKMHCTIVCKDARTIVTDSNEKKIYINMSGNDGMATAGSGDVLSGIMGAMTAVSMSMFEKACVSVYLHGLCGAAASRELSKHSLLASDIIGYLTEYLE